MGWEANKKSKSSDAYPKSIGENVNNENQIITPFEWKHNADRSEVSVTLKDKYKLSGFYTKDEIDTLIDAEAHKPPVGIPTFWFTSVLPDWALDCGDGATGYEFNDYPELDNEIFRQFLADFSDFASADDTTTFDMPDLQGMFMRLAGTNGIYGTSYYIGGEVGDYQTQQLQYHTHHHSGSSDDHYHGRNYLQCTDDNAGWYNYAIRNYGNTGSWGNETKPCSFTGMIIVRFE